MRIRVSFKVNNRGGLVPFHHQYLIAGVINEVLAGSSVSAYRDYAFFSFSGIKGQTRLGKNGLHFNSKMVTIVFSSASREFLDHLVKLILNQKEVQVGNLKLTPELAQEEMPVQLEKGTKYVCISPMVLVSPKDDPSRAKDFMQPFSDEFSDYLYESTIDRMTSFGMNVDEIPEVQKFQLVPDEHYLAKIKAENKKFARVYPMYDGGDKYEVRGYTIPFTLYAAAEIQDFLYTCGLGLHSNKGFGMLDLANSDPTERIVDYAKRENLVSS